MAVADSETGEQGTTNLIENEGRQDSVDGRGQMKYRIWKNIKILGVIFVTAAIAFGIVHLVGYYRSKDGGKQVSQKNPPGQNPQTSRLTANSFECWYAYNHTCDAPTCKECVVPVEAVLTTPPYVRREEDLQEDFYHNSSCFEINGCKNFTYVRNHLADLKSQNPGYNCDRFLRMCNEDGYCKSGTCGCASATAFSCSCINGYGQENAESSCSMPPNPKKVSCSCHDIVQWKFFNLKDISHCGNYLWNSFDSQRSQEKCWYPYSFNGMALTCICNTTTVDDSEETCSIKLRPERELPEVSSPNSQKHTSKSNTGNQLLLSTYVFMISPLVSILLVHVCTLYT